MTTEKAGSPPIAPPHTGRETHLLREIMRTQQAILGAFSRTVGVPAARLALVRLLAIAGPAGAGVMDLARRSQINAAAITRQVALLERAGLVTRKTDLQDKRRASLRLTLKGRRLFETVHARAHAFEDALTVAVTPEETAAAIRVLVAVRTGIEKTA